MKTRVGENEIETFDGGRELPYAAYITRVSDGTIIEILDNDREAVALALLGGLTDELVRQAADGLRDWNYGRDEGLTFNQAWWDEQARAVIAAIFGPAAGE